MAGEVGIKIKVSAKDADRNLNKLKNSSNKLSEAFNKVTRRSQKTQTAFRNTGKAARSASTGVRSLAASLRPLLAAFAVIGSARFVFVKTAELETQRKSLEKLTGSATKTNRIIKELQDFGAVTPFTSTELISSAQRLKAFGIDTEKLVDVTKQLADVSGAVGKPLGEVAAVYGKIQAKGRMTMEELLQFQERGINVTDELSKITGLYGDDLLKAMSKGKLGADLVEQAFINLTKEGGLYFEGAISQSQTLAGRFSTLVDSVETLARNVGEKLGPAIKTILNLAIDAVNQINRLITRVSAGPQIAQAELQARQKAIQETKEKFNFNVGAVEGPLAGAGVEEFFKERLEINTADAVNKILNKNLDVEGKIADAAKTTLKTNKDIKNVKDGINNTENNINDKNNKLNKTLDEQKQKYSEITNILASGMTNAVMGLIDGTKTLSQSLAGVARQLASMFLNRAFSSMFGSFFEQGGYSRAGSFKAFQYGGVVNSPTLGMVGEGGEPEYIIPASKMDGAMSRYSAGARGGAVIPGGSHEAGTVAGASGSTVVEYTGPVLNFNGDDYVPKDSVPQIISAAAQQGASMGQSKMMSTLKNSRSQRSKIGI